MKKCSYCKIILGKDQYVYCSNKCQKNKEYENYIEKWKKGHKNGGVGISVRTISGHVRRYLLHKFNRKCVLCGWNKNHPKTGFPPLEIDHIDGNSDNNSEKNLRLICPNCHSLTSNYKNHNYGKGRQWRMKKYIKNVA